MAARQQARAKMGRHATVGEYLAAQPRPARAALAVVRRIVRKAMPGAEEKIAYGIPAYRLHGRIALYFAAWKEHFSLYPSNDRLVAAFRKALARYELSKGTIRFPLAEPVPVKLIEGIARFRASEALAAAKLKAKPKAKARTAKKPRS